MKPREIAALRQRGSDGVAPASGGSFVAPTRQVASVTTPSLAPDAVWNGTITLAKAYRLYAVQADGDCRLIIYTDTGSRTADASRALGVLPAPGAGVVMEFWFGPGPMSATLSPVVDGFSAAIPATSSIPITVTNLSTSSAALTINLVYLVVEE